MIRPVERDEQYLTILERSTPSFTVALERVARAYIEGRNERNGIAALAEVIGRNLAIAGLLGRESAARIVRAANEARKMFRRGDKALTIVPNVPFSEALDDIRRRTPEVAKYATREAVAEIIEKNGFTLAYATKQPIVEAVQRAILRLQDVGGDAASSGAVIGAMGDWTQAYGETVYRTTISGGFAQGRFDQISEPEAREAIPALRYSAVDDGAVRPNHIALDGFVATSAHIEWHRIKPPNGFRCRCGIDFVDVFDYEEMAEQGMLRADGAYYPPDFGRGGPDPGFTKRGA